MSDLRRQLYLVAPGFVRRRLRRAWTPGLTATPGPLPVHLPDGTILGYLDVPDPQHWRPLGAPGRPDSYYWAPEDEPTLYEALAHAFRQRRERALEKLRALLA